MAVRALPAPMLGGQIYTSGLPGTTTDGTALIGGLGSSATLTYAGNNTWVVASAFGAISVE